MKIKISTDLNTIEFWAIGDEIPRIAGTEMRQDHLLIHTFGKPALITDNAAIARLPSVQRDLVIRLLEFPQRIIEYDNISLEWSDMKYPGVWSPSIDTALFIKALRKLFSQPEYLNGVSSFLEIGCGSGFLSKYTIVKKLNSGKPIVTAELMDINKDALICAQDNIKDISRNTNVIYTLNKANTPIKPIGAYDLIICNPPYIPRPCSDNSNPFEGLFLYGEILDKTGELLNPEGSLIINFSSISKPDIYSEYEKKFSIEILEKIRIPLKIPLITARLSQQSKDWMDYLIKNNKLETDESEKDGYRYWQTIEIAQCKLKR